MNTQTTIIPAHPCIVLDTNICLDLFVFHDPRWAPLLAELDAGTVRAVTRADCRDEYRVVLHYAHLPLDTSSRPLAAAAFDRRITVVEAGAKPLRLPVCTDKDDQKFLEVARDAGADVLITKDKALLKLARKTAALGLFQVLLPEAWLKLRAAQPAPQPASPPASQPACQLDCAAAATA